MIILSQILSPLEIISVQDAAFPFVGLVWGFFPQILPLEACFHSSFAYSSPLQNLFLRISYAYVAS